MTGFSTEDTKDIPTLVKDPELVEKRRAQIVGAAVRLFSEKGFHETTTREIGRATGFSIGTLYEYIQSKEDVLYLVCDAIHREMEESLRAAIQVGVNGRETLEQAIAAYIEVCDKMQDSILLVYRETSSLKNDSMGYVLRNEERVTSLFEDILRTGVKDKSLSVADPKAIELMSHNIAVIGHTWALRRWALRKRYRLSEYIALQTSLILRELSAETPISRGKSNTRTRR